MIQVNDADLAKIRLKCLELAQVGDPSTTIKRAALYVGWCVRDRTDRTERTSPGTTPAPPALPERLASFKLGMQEMERRFTEAGAKPSLVEKVKSTLSIGRKPR